MAVVTALLKALAECAAHAARPGESGSAGTESADAVPGGRAVLSEQNLPAALRAVRLLGFQKNRTAVVSVVSAVLYAFVEHPEAAPQHAAAVREACVEMLIGLGLEASTKALRSAAELSPELPGREHLLVAADRAGNTLPSQLAETAVPSHGLDENGMRVLAVNRGEYKHEYLLSLHEGGQVSVADMDPDAPVDPESERIVEEAVRAIQETVESERRRIEGLMALDRRWNVKQWKKLYVENPVTRAITCGLLWEFGHYIPTYHFISWNGGVRPHPGRFVEDSWSYARLTHPCDLDGQTHESLRQEGRRLGVVEPFPQLKRRFRRPAASSEVELAEFRGRRLTAPEFARLDFPDERLSLSVESADAIESAWFHWTADEDRTPIRLDELPPRILSEGWYHLEKHSKKPQPGKAAKAEEIDSKPAQPAVEDAVPDERPAVEDAVQAGQPAVEDAVPAQRPAAEAAVQAGQPEPAPGERQRRRWFRS